MPRMNGSSSSIEIFKPFGEAFELMKKTLFQPFDLKKWLVIGFAAWLASLGGGGGRSFNYESQRGPAVLEVHEMIRPIPHPIPVVCLVVVGVVAGVLIVLFCC